jgi:hypothetical protein
MTSAYFVALRRCTATDRSGTTRLFGIGDRLPADQIHPAALRALLRSGSIRPACEVDAGPDGRRTVAC